jgi:hypothetical protein
MDKVQTFGVAAPAKKRASNTKVRHDPPDRALIRKRAYRKE